MKAGIIGAMEQEVAILKSNMTNVTEKQIANYRYFSGNIGGTEVVLVQSGIGKVSAALATLLMIEHFSVDYIVNTGSAGGFAKELNVGDIVIGAQLSYHDVDVTAFGYSIGQVPGMPAYFSAHPVLVKAAQTGTNELPNINTITGLITSGDTFMTKQDDISKARKNFPTMVAVEMEGAAIAHTCQQFKVPFVVIRSISDIAGKESATSFDEYLVTAAVNSSQLVLNMLIELKAKSLN
ncbi:5'-methylthioadenosine/adenosylhomocysteine nucleosidase [Colwelliaceae bacterium BS250]